MRPAALAPTPRSTGTGLPASARRRSRPRALALAFVAALLAVGCAGDDDDEPVQPVTREPVSNETQDPSEDGPDMTAVLGNAPPPSNEPVTALPPPLDPCTLVAPDAVTTLLGPAEAVASENRCRWEGATGYLELVLEPIPVGVSQIETINARIDVFDPDAPAVEGVGQFGFVDEVAEGTQIFIIWGGWTALITSDQPLDAVTTSVSGLPRA
jgi:hypothetical protein